MFTVFYNDWATLLHLKHLLGGFMLNYAIIFFIVAIIAAVFGFGGIAAGAAGIAKILFFVFLVLAVLSFIFGRRR